MSTGRQTRQETPQEAPRAAPRPQKTSRDSWLRPLPAPGAQQAAPSPVLWAGCPRRTLWGAAGGRHGVHVTHDSPGAVPPRSTRPDPGEAQGETPLHGSRGPSTNRLGVPGGGWGWGGALTREQVCRGPLVTSEMKTGGHQPGRLPPATLQRQHQWGEVTRRGFAPKQTQGSEGGLAAGDKSARQAFVSRQCWVFATDGGTDTPSRGADQHVLATVARPP